jgi:hypothetical protein
VARKFDDTQIAFTQAILRQMWPQIGMVEVAFDSS